MADLKNNLFYYATKELSQDAFICWLCSHALIETDSDDAELKQCAKNLICAFIEKHIGDKVCCEDVRLINVEKQVGNIDVLLTLNYKDKEYKINVEDKINTSEHDNQLARYMGNLANGKAELIGIYFKTGFQSDLSAVEAAGYKLFGRKDILDILQKCNSRNAILLDYRAYWENFEDIAQSYNTKTLDKWPDWQAVNGFYDEMQADIMNMGEFWAEYGWVSNRSGGFWGLWYGFNEDKISSEKIEVNLYLQMETKWNESLCSYQANICLKFENNSEGDEYMPLLEYIIREQEKYGFVKPNKMRKGAHMTVGKYNVDLNSASCKDLKKYIMESARQYKELLENAKEKFNGTEVI